MSPAEAIAYLKSKAVALPKGAAMVVRKDAVLIGNDDANFLIQGPRLETEELVLLTAQQSLPALEDAMRVMALRKQDIATADAKLKAGFEASRKRKPGVIRK